MKIFGFLLVALLAFASPALAQNPQTVKLCIPTTGTACGAVTASNPLPITGSFSATLAGFTPNGNYTTLTATASSSASTTLPAGTVVAFQNLSTIDVSCVLTNGASTATTNKLIVRAGATVYYTIGANTTAACINQTGSASNVVGLAGGAGLGTAFGGASAGGGGGGAVTLASGAVASGAYSAGSIAAGAYVSGSILSGALASGAVVDLTNLSTPIAAATATATKGILLGGQFDTTQKTLTNGQQAALSVSNRGALFVETGVNNLVVVGAGTAGTASGGVVTIQGVAAMTKLLVTPDSVALPANQSVNVSQINAVTPLMGNGVTGTGSQRVTIASDNTAFTVNAAQSGTWNITNISGTVTLPTLASTSTKQSDGTQKTQVVDGSGNVIASTSNALNVQCANCSGSGVSAADAATFTAGTSLFAPIGGQFTSGGATACVTGHECIAGMTAARALFTDMSSIAGTTTLTGNGVTGAGAQRVTIASDNTAFSVNATLSAETTKVIGTTRTVGNVGGVMDAVGQNVAAPANWLQAGCQFQTTPTTITATNGSPCQMDNAGNILVNVKTATGLAQGSTTSGQSGSLVMGAVTTASPSYTTAQTSPLSLDPAGSLRVAIVSGAGSGGTAIADGATFTEATTSFTPVGGEYVSGGGANCTTGKGCTLQLTIDRMAYVNVGKINGVVPLMGNGVTGTGSSRVTLASDGTAISTAGFMSVKVDQTTPGTTNNVTVLSNTAPVSTMNSASASSGVTAANAFVFDDASPTAITENSFGYGRMSANRNQYHTIRDAAGNERGANVSAGNALLVDGSATTQPVNVSQFGGVSTATGQVAVSVAPVTATNTALVTALRPDSPGIINLGQTTKSASVPVAVATDQLGANTAANSLPITVGPALLGSYCMGANTGTMAAGLAGGSPIYSFRYGGANLAIVRKVVAEADDVTTAFVAGTAKFDMFAARSFSASDTGGTAATLTGNNGKLRTSYATTAISDLRISSTATLTAGTRTLDAQPLASVAFSVSTTIDAGLLPTTEIYRSNIGESPFVLANNEGFVIQATVPGTGTWFAAVRVCWDEVSAF